MANQESYAAIFIDCLNPETTSDHKTQTRAALGGKRTIARSASDDSFAPIPAVRRQSGNLSGSEPQSCRSSSASRWLIVTRSGPRSELEVALVRASLLAHGSRGDSRQPDRPLMSRGRQQVPARDHLAPGIDAPSQGRHYRGGASYARLRSVARGPPGDRARIPLGSDGSRSE